MVTGYRLASPSQFKHSLELGVDQLVIFATTFLVTLGTDLLVGVASGVLMKVLFHLARGLPLKLLFKSEVEVSEGPDGIRIFLKKGAVFSNFLGVKRHLDSIPLKRRVQIDVTSVTFIDHTVMEKLHEFISQYNERGGDAGLVGLESLTAHGNHELSARGIRK
jgi:MFS superfamily sulfate permease-like transporter